ncbi:HlyC/CorC family transporter [Neoehrlichia mikurensis]|uniref:Hemolysin family protein n=1 Tax=Neoehrlichia mikurensis TaxID=89586 RepID=A0A9Q9BU90_9RICK|nr:hemolysin family protein [Neoehrlichia mikurensis]QXK92320.1 HlyC/CorC family transporter [Neoehrlichia mikurensis]QXK92774.1 HlyC/CorC family transporter [Neoehrlichia mikurensis]QXK94015.1 HlyC/CorC family transporter [Neoehrlichia mikurensis]UTO55822.1 hemolysin family protein [Neoehrlichia mikurensis]UTO56737.1 hemolysin family protein [Neoehrlichia mikurensis]
MDKKLCGDEFNGNKHRGFKNRIFSFLLRKFPSFREFAEHQLLYDNKLHLSNFHVLHNLIKFNDCAVKDIMIPRAEIYAVNISEENLIEKIIIQGQHTRIPVYKDNLDNIVGFLHIKDVMSKIDQKFNVKDIIHNVIYVPPSMKAVNLFVKMQSSHMNVAVVLDEYGCTEGLVTMADLIEEIVGDISDEHDISSSQEIINISDNKIEVNARVLVETLEQSLNINLRDCEEEYVTVGGLILSMIGRIPMVDEVFEHKSGAVFLVKEVDDRCIHKVIIDLSNVKKSSY